MTIGKNSIKVPTSEAREMIRNNHEFYDRIHTAAWESRHGEDFCDFIVQNKLDSTLWLIPTIIGLQRGAEFYGESEGFVTLYAVKPIQKTVTEYVII